MFSARGKAHVGQNVVAEAVHQYAKLWLLFSQGVCHDLPLGFGLGLGLLRDDRFRHRRDRRALLGRSMGQGVPHPVNAAPLVGGVEHPTRGRPEALVVIGDHQFHICGVEPEAGPRPLQGAGQERVHPLVDLGSQAAELAFGHAARAHALDQIVDRARRDTVDVGLLDDGHKRLLRCAARLQKAGKNSCPCAD